MRRKRRSYITRESGEEDRVEDITLLQARAVYGLYGIGLLFLFPFLFGFALVMSYRSAAKGTWLERHAQEQAKIFVTVLAASVPVLLASTAYYFSPEESTLAEPLQWAVIATLFFLIGVLFYTAGRLWRGWGSLIRRRSVPAKPQ